MKTLTTSFPSQARWFVEPQCLLRDWRHALPLLVLSIGVGGLLPSPIHAQPERFVLGQKLRACEMAWEKAPAPAERTRAVEHLKQSVSLFFGFKLAEAGRAMDDARFALESATPPTAERRWAESLYLRLSTRLADPTSDEVTVSLQPLYSVEWRQKVPEEAAAQNGAAVPPDLLLRITLLLEGQPARQLINLPLRQLPLTSPLPINALAEGDYLLRSQILRGKEVLATREETLSLSRNLRPRLAQIEKSILAFANQPSTTDLATARSLHSLLVSLAEGKTLETNYPAFRLLLEAAALARDLSEMRRFYGGPQQVGQFWLTLALPGSTVPVRLQAPPQVAAGQPLPLVLALHGAGGSENLFFDGYGQGAVATLSAKRGWLVVAPRGSTGFRPERAAEIIDAVDRLYRVDRQRVFLVGHSMGGAQVVASAQATPNAFAGAAVLGGGGQVLPGAAISQLPFFIGIGSEDFALPNARRLETGLRERKVESLLVRDYPGIEHLVIVQVALPDVFAFFDQAAKRGSR
ncbi:MAG: alpha/beta fold hydrolase [Blastocatellia bacterium]